MFRKMLLAVVAGLGLIGSTSVARANDTEQQVLKLFREEAKLREAKKYRDAMNVLKQILELEPRNTWAFSEAAWLLNENKEHTAAINHAEVALEYNLNNSDAWRELGYALMKLNRNMDATKALSTAIEKNPRNWYAYDYLSTNYEKLGKFQAASKVRNQKESELAKAREESDMKKASTK